MTIDDISQTQIDQISTDFQAFLDKRSRRFGQRKRRGVKPFRKAGTLPSDEHVLDFAHGYYDADPVAEAFVKDAYIDGNSSGGRAMLDPGSRTRNRCRSRCAGVDGAPVLRIRNRSAVGRS